MISGDRPTHLLSLVSLAGILALLSFALWPVFLQALAVNGVLAIPILAWSVVPIFLAICWQRPFWLV
jgi:hypothetical protein